METRFTKRSKLLSGALCSRRCSTRLKFVFDQVGNQFKSISLLLARVSCRIMKTRFTKILKILAGLSNVYQSITEISSRKLLEANEKSREISQDNLIVHYFKINNID